MPLFPSIGLNCAHSSRNSAKIRSMYDARNLRQFVLRKSRHSGGASTRKSICAIRMFLRFLISQGKCPASLYASVPSLAHWRLSALPRYLQPDQVEKIIASADLRTPLGSRNRAILLLLARLGLRAGDIVRLRFSDIDWKEGTDPCLRQGPPRNGVAAVPRGWRCAGSLYKGPSSPS